jgi:hypothetical protein
MLQVRFGNLDSADLEGPCDIIIPLRTGSVTQLTRHHFVTMLQRYFSKILPRLKSVDHLAATIRSGYQFLLNQFSRSTALVVGKWSDCDHSKKLLLCTFKLNLL